MKSRPFKRKSQVIFCGAIYLDFSSVLILGFPGSDSVKPFSCDWYLISEALNKPINLLPLYSSYVLKLIWVVSNRCSGLDFRLRLCCRHWIVVAAWTRLVVPVGFSDDFPINEERRKKVFQGGLSFCWVKAGEVAKRAALVCFQTFARS